MSYELLIQHGSNIMFPPVVEGVTIEWERKGQPGKMTFEVVKTDGLSFQEGDPCRFSVDGTPVFYGFVFEKSRKGSNPNVIKCIVYDQLYYAGTLIPVEYVSGLTLAELVELIVPGDEEEETETFRQRVLDSFQSQAFGGNQADYIEKVRAIAGVGAVKVHAVWNGDISPSELIPGDEATAWYEATVSSLEAPVAAWLTAIYTAAQSRKLTVGGTVRLVIMASNNAVPSETFLEEIQTAVDPVQNAGEGLGLAPIGHVVNVVGVEPETVDITLNLTYAAGWDWAAVQSYVVAVIDDYFAELAESWATADFLTVRISQIESRILSACSAMVTDIGGTQINGVEANLVLGADSIPVRGAVNG